MVPHVAFPGPIARADVVVELERFGEVNELRQRHGEHDRQRVAYGCGASARVGGGGVKQNGSRNSAEASRAHRGYVLIVLGEVRWGRALAEDQNKLWR